MQIHIFANSYSLHAGGAEKLVRQLHRRLLRLGENSRLIGLTQQDDAQENDATSLGLGSPYHPLAFFRLWRYARKHVRPGDVVHGHLFPTIFYLSVLRLLGVLRTPTIMTEHSTRNRRRGSRPGRLIDWITYRGYDRIFAISSGVSDALLTWQPALQGRVKVVYNGIELANTEPRQHDDSAAPVVLSVGNLRPSKNYGNMLSAIASLDDIPFEYWIAGDGPLRESLERQVSELGLEDKVKFLGRVDKLQPLYHSAHVFLMASAWEGFGLAAVEAMDASLPVVISGIPGLSEIDHGSSTCSVRVDPGSIDSIAGALRSLLCSSEQRLDLGTSGFYQSRRFSLDAMVGSYLHEYRACLEL